MELVNIDSKQITDRGGIVKVIYRYPDHIALTEYVFRSDSGMPFIPSDDILQLMIASEINAYETAQALFFAQQEQNNQ